MQELSKRKLSIYAQLSSRKQRLRHGLFIVEGEKSVADTIAFYQPEAVIIRTGFTPVLFSLTSIDDDKIFYTGDVGMDKLSSLSNSPDVAAIYRLPDDSEIEENSKGKLDEALYILLDGIQDPGNLGTIIRTAHWFGIKRIFASKDTADIYNPKTIQATMGSLPHIRVEYCELSDIIASNPDFPVYGLLLDGKNIYEAQLEQTGFIIMGNEGKGISKRIRENVTVPLLIPPYYPDFHGESLNVAIATGVTLSVFRSRIFS